MNEKQFIDYALKTTDLSGEKALLSFNKIASFNSPAISEKKDFSGLKTISFTTKFPKFNSFWKTLLKRRTHRNFSKNNVNLKQLKVLISAGFLKTDDFFITPSAGGMRAISGYIINYNIEHLDKGIYYIDEQNQNLAFIEKQTIDKKVFFTDENILQKIDFALILTSNFYSLLPKYGTRSLRLGILDAGHLMQNLLLGATHLGIKSIPLGGFDEDVIIKFLQLEKEYPIYCAIFSK